MIIELPGIPTPKARHRSFIRHGHIASYDPQSTHKEAVKAMLRARRPKDPIRTESSYEVELEFYMPVPGSMSKPKTSLTLWLAQHNHKPDVDNLAKFYLDAANGILWEDDKSITSLKVSKYYCTKPRTVIRVMQNKPAVFDEKASGILSNFTPDDYATILQLLAKACSDMGEVHGNKEKISTRAAVYLSQLADQFAAPLSKIAKKYPGYYKEER